MDVKGDQEFAGVSQWVWTEWSALLSGEMALLRQIPSSGVQKFCDVVSGRKEYDLGFMARLAEGSVTRAERMSLWERQRDISSPWYLPVAQLKDQLRWLSLHCDGEARDRASCHLEALSGVHTPKAAEFRRVIGLLIKREYGSKFVPSGWGSWIAPLEIAGMGGFLEIDFGGMAHGFRYQLRISVPDFKYPLDVAYERSLGILSADWDLIRSDAMEQQAIFLLSLVKKMQHAFEDVDVMQIVRFFDPNRRAQVEH